jgi:hypothetical protein
VEKQQHRPAKASTGPGRAVAQDKYKRKGGDEMNTIIKIRHYGLPFVNSDCARLLLSGVLYHYVLLTQ